MFSKNLNENIPEFCPICFSEKIFPDRPLSLTSEDQLKAFGKLTIYLCSKCGFAFSYPRCNHEELNSYYENHYRPRFYKNFENGDWPIPDMRSIAQLYLALLFCQFNKNELFLDIGTGVGASLTSACMMLNYPELAIIEKSKKLIDFLTSRIQGLNVFSDFNEARKNNKKAKIILLSHSLEHFFGNDIIDLMKNINDLLDDKGVIIVEVPNCDLREEYFKNRKGYAPHTSFFSIDSIKYMANNIGMNQSYINAFGVERGIDIKYYVEEQKKYLNSIGMNNISIVRLAGYLMNTYFKTINSGGVLRVVLSKQ